MTASAQMPLIQTEFTADPAPMVKGDTVYLYTTHDEDYGDGFEMRDWLLYTSTDMVNWENHGAVASLRDFKWYDSDNGAWAEQVIYRNGKYYMYCPIHGHGIGVLVSDSPYGPFKDPLGKPFIWQKEHWYDIDPTVWIDDDGQAYLYWGNPILYHVKLNEDMISYSGGIVEHPRIQDYQEGPWFWKHGDWYYLAFASTCCPEGIGYAMSKGPEGPWEYKGHIMNHTPRTRGNHPGIIDFKGKSYVFGLNYDLLRMQMPEHHERRSVSAAEMHYNADGTIQEVPYFKDSAIEPVRTFNPYQRVQAETMAWGWGLKVVENGQYLLQTNTSGGFVKYQYKPRTESHPQLVVTDIDEGETLTLRDVDFGTLGARTFIASTASLRKGGQIEIHLDRSNGPVIGALDVPCTGSLEKFVTSSCQLSGATGVHDLVFKFYGAAQKDMFRWDWWEMGTQELIKPIPDHIRKPAAQQGTIETFTYNVKREDGTQLTKKARVYLPYGYKESKQKYNVVYLMHGGGDNSRSFLTPPHDWLPLAQVLDHLIEEGQMEPVIVVTPSFYDNDENIGQNRMEDAIRQTTWFHKELAHDLIPQVERAYRTYFKGDIAKSREHRAYGGFSMGALSTWNQLAYGVDAVKYFLPLSGDLWIFNDKGERQSMEVAAKWLNDKLSTSPYAKDFRIWGWTGTEDIAGNPERSLVENLRLHAPLFNADNLYFAMKTGGQHYYGDINEYLYYALPLIWK